MHISLYRIIGVVLPLLAVLCSRLEAEDWPRFLGPNGSGVSQTTGLPAEFGPNKNLVWKVELPFSRSSPIVAGECVFVTGSENDKLVTLCLNRETGKILWRRDVVRERATEIFEGNDPASPTPVSDGKNVYVFFPDLGLISYTSDGDERWRRPLGPFDNFYGMGASPILAGEMVVLNCDQQTNSFLIAVDRSDGSVRWKVERETLGESWTTPVLCTHADGKREVVIFGSLRVDAYDVDSGERRWWYGGVGSTPVGSPILYGNKLLAIGPQHGEAGMPPPFDVVIKSFDKDGDGRMSREEVRGDELFGGHFGWLDTDENDYIEREEYSLLMKNASTDNYGAVAIDLGVQGEVPDSQVAWRYKKGLPYVVGPLAYKNVVYLAKDGGIITSLDASNGAVLKRGRATGALGKYFASPTAADDKVFLVNEEGKVAVLKAGAEWELLAVNDLGEECYATPAIADGRIYIRTRTALYCFGKTPSSTTMIQQ